MMEEKLQKDRYRLLRLKARCYIPSHRTLKKMMRVPKRTSFLPFLTRREVSVFLGRGQGPMALLSTPRSGCWTDMLPG